MLGVDDSVQPKLARHVEPDIEQFVPKVEQAMRAYAICKERLDAVQATLGQYLQPKDGIPAQSTGTERHETGRGPLALPGVLFCAGGFCP
jgi:hypothetical protein